MFAIDGHIFFKDLRRWIKSVATFPCGPMEDRVAIVAATNQPEQRFGGGKMDFKFAAVAGNRRPSLPRIPWDIGTRRPDLGGQKFQKRKVHHWNSQAIRRKPDAAER
jgi:hypothetical protein